MLFFLSGLTLWLWSSGSFLVALEAGFRLGRRRQGLADATERAHSSSLQGATLGLLALLLGFTFAMSVARFDSRKDVLRQQANAIGTAELRSRLLPSPHADAAAPLFRDYVDVWIHFKKAGINLAAMDADEARAAEIEGHLWAIARAVTAADPHSIPGGLFAAAMNEVIDQHENRRRSLEDRVPETVILLLFAVSTLSLGQVGYSSGLSGRRRPIANTTFALLISVVLLIIVDLDRPRRGFIQVSQESMIRLQRSLGPVTPQRSDTQPQK